MGGFNPMKALELSNPVIGLGAESLGKGAFSGGGSGSKKGGAEAPDFMGLAKTPTSNPYGSETWGPNGKSFQFTGQAADINKNLMGGMLGASQMDPTQAGNQARDSVYGFSQSRLDPEWQARGSAFDAKLANQGLDPGGEAYRNASQDFGARQNDAYAQARAQAVGLGQQEQAQQRANSMMPFQEAQTLLGMGTRQPDLSGLLGAAGQQYGASQDAQSAKNAKKGSTMSGLGGIGGMMFGGPAGAMVGSQAGSALGGGGGKKGNSQANQFTPGGAYEGWT